MMQEKQFLHLQYALIDLVGGVLEDASSSTPIVSLLLERSEADFEYTDLKNSVEGLCRK
ncbi:MAG: hypothetical protein MSG78_00245 [Clostridiales bacterium]|nr:hypothetical protein [Clostridiales bacterium]